jgi:poly-beta-1,6-N-acetyl-D-glucosamine synthase
MNAEIVFWCAVLFLVYTHAGYPLLLWMRARARAGNESAAAAGTDTPPMVSILVVAYKEAARIEARLDNLLALDYPRERL